MTEKRFEFREVNCSVIVPRVYDTEKQQYANLFECVHWLNELNDECEFLEIENESLEHGATRYAELYHQSLKENEQLKLDLVEVHEICAYYEDRIHELNDMNSLIEDEIDKKIAALTDAKIKSFQNEDEKLFEKVKFGIQILRELKEVILE